MRKHLSSFLISGQRKGSGHLWWVFVGLFFCFLWVFFIIFKLSIAVELIFYLTSTAFNQEADSLNVTLFNQKSASLQHMFLLSQSMLLGWAVTE